MKRRRVKAMLLAGIMGVTLLTGCGVSEEEGTGNDVEVQEDGETEDIKVALMCLSPVDESATKHVEEALNEMLLEKVNVQADFMWFDPNTYATQVPMMIQAGEALDLMMFNPVPGSGFQSFMSQNQLMDITEYVDEYGDNIQKVMGEYLEATSKDGAVYGVGNMTSLYAAEGICMRKDILEELQLTEKAENMTSWSEFQEILESVTSSTDLNGIINSDQDGTCIAPQPYINGGESFEKSYWVDTLGDTYQYVYADPDTHEVKCYFAGEEWYENAKLAKQLYDAGLIYKDAATSQDWGESLLKNGVGFSQVKGIEDGSLSSIQASTGHDFIIKEIANAKVSTGAFQKFGFAVPVTSKHPEAAIKVLNLLFGDEDVQNTITWGVEDVDWVRQEDGTLTYPEGVTADTVQYHMADFLYGNRLSVSPWEGDGADVRERQTEQNKNAEKSEFFGFSVDTAAVSGEIAACKNVIDQYKPQLLSGNVDDVDATYDKFMSALSAAGIDKILETYQTQLDNWLKQK